MAPLAPFTLRPAQARGHAQHGAWLDTWHSFSFGDYHDPEHMGHSVLRVINDDRVAGRRGFSPHPHRDMEILTVVLAGAVAHEDSTGGKAILKAGEVQRMTAGRGIVHSEMNPGEEELHLLQIWVLPQRLGLEPGYEQKAFPKAERLGQPQLVAAPGAPGGALDIHQDLKLWRLALDAEHPQAEITWPEARRGWLQVASGGVLLQGKALQAGDGARFDQGGTLALDLDGRPEVELLFFDLP